MNFFLSINNDDFNKYITNIMNFDDVSLIFFMNQVIFISTKNESSDISKNVFY